MADHGREIRFGYFLIPAAASPLVDTAREVESLGFDYIGVQDHPYQRRYVEGLGAYGPRALALTGRVADGWLPSYQGDWAALAGMVSRLDEAAAAAGRAPSDLRRVLNIGQVGSDPGATADLLFVAGGGSSASTRSCSAATRPAPGRSQSTWRRACASRWRRPVADPAGGSSHRRGRAEVSARAGH